MSSNVNTIPTSAITTQADVTVSRAIDGTVYQNTSTKPKFISVSITQNLNATITGKSDANATPALVVVSGGNSNLSSVVLTIFFVVLPGYYYSIACVNSALVVWVEYV